MSQAEAFTIATPNYELKLPDPPQTMPEFDMTPIMSKDRRFLFGGPAQTCSIPCTTYDVNLIPNSVLPVCGFQVNNCIIKAVGNGWVNISPNYVLDIPNCGKVDVLVNGLPSPVYVTDGSIIDISLYYEPGWNADCCSSIIACPVKCLSAQSMVKNLLRYKMKEGKMRINPETGLPIVVIDKKELLRRIIERRQKSRRKK